MTDKTLIRTMLNMIQSNEWQTRHAAENKYCQYCSNDGDLWVDQKEHHADCLFVKVTQQAQERIDK